MGDTIDKNTNENVKKDKPRLKLKIKLIIASILVALGALYLFEEPLLVFVTEIFLATEYDDLKDEGIAKYDVIKVESVKAVDINNKEEMDKLNDYFICTVH